MVLVGEDGVQEKNNTHTQFWSGQVWKRVPDCSSMSRETNMTGSKVSAEVKSTNYAVTFSLYILQLVTSVFASAAPSNNNRVHKKLPIIG